MAELEKVIKGLQCLSNPYILDMDERDCENCKYDNASCFLDVTADALSLLKAQGEVIDALLKVGYPHNFQMEEPWIVNYMYAITGVIKKAVNLRNG